MPTTDKLRVLQRLDWPPGWSRTTPYQRRGSRYRVTYERALSDLFHSLTLLRARDVIVTHDRRSLARPDPGVAVYWSIGVTNPRPFTRACDQWLSQAANVRAIGLAVDALRAMQRSGASQVLERAYAGLLVLPPSIDRRWPEVLGVPGDAPWPMIQEAYRSLVRRHHPDHGGSDHAMAEINAALVAAKAARQAHFT
jgi:hypothetical protein